jgi:hypothetical protein
MQSAWTDETHGTITIPDGPAAGSYAFDAFSNVEDHMLHLGPHHIGTPVRIVQLKIDLVKHLPYLEAEMVMRKAAVLGFLAAKKASAARKAQQAVDQSMAKAGFSTGYPVLDREIGYQVPE